MLIFGFRWRDLAACMLSALLAGSVVAAPCAKSDEEAVRLFIGAYVGSNATNPADFMQPVSLSAYRRRLAQLLDDRYAPASPRWRATVLGDDWTPARIGAATDAELLGAYFMHAASIRPPVTISDLRIVPSGEESRVSAPLHATFRVESGGTSHAGGAYLEADEIEGCWKVAVPMQAWAQIDKVASVLEATRPQPAPVSPGRQRMKLRVLAANVEPVAGAKPLAGWRQPLWVDGTPLATEANLTGASAWWTCSTGRGPEAAGIALTLDDRVVQAFANLPGRPDFPMIAIVVDGQVRTAARVHGVLGRALEVCDSESSLEQAQAMAAALRGDAP